MMRRGSEVLEVFAGRAVEPCAYGGAVVPTVSEGPVSCDGGDNSVRDRTDATVLVVSDVEAAGGVHSDGIRQLQLGTDCQAVVREGPRDRRILPVEILVVARTQPYPATWPEL